MPSVDYVVVVNLLPQDATKTEKAFVLDVAHESRQTILQSADDAQRLVKPGKPGSKVVVWDAERWPGDIVAYLGVPVELKRLNPGPPPPPPSTTIWGLHMRSGGPCRDSDFECVRIAGLKAAKLTTENPPETVDRLVAVGVPAASIVVRLFADLSDRSVKPAEFCDWMKLPIQLFMAKGVRYFEVHNEPNLPQEGLGVAWLNAPGFATWYSAVMQILRRDHAGVKVGFPGLSPQPNVTEWLTACDSVMRSSDWIGVHCYWTDASLMSNPEHGGYYQRFVARLTGKEFIITEFSNPSPSVAKGEKGKQYKAYYQQLPSSIKSAFCFISSSPSFPHEAWADEIGNISEIPYNVK